MIAIFVALVTDSIALQSSTNGGVHVVRDFELIVLCEDKLNSTDDGPIRHWARGWYHPYAHSHKQHMNHVHS